jgi:hypothetical protein
MFGFADAVINRRKVISPGSDEYATAGNARLAPAAMAVAIQLVLGICAAFAGLVLARCGISVTARPARPPSLKHLQRVSSTTAGATT